MPKWTQELDDQVAGMWGQGLSSGQIARHLGKTRNAVMGKIKRLGLLRMTERHKAAAFYQAHQEAKAMPKPQPLPEAPKPVSVPLSAPVSLLAATSRQCRWIVQEVPPMVCGVTTEPGSSWCAHHRALCYTRHERKKDIQKWGVPI